MSISLGSTNIGSLYLGSTKIGEAYLGSTKVYASTPSPDYNPLNLPPYTIRLKFKSGTTPSFNYGTAVRVSSSPNVWDLTYENADWKYLLMYQSSLVEVLGANTSSVTSMSSMFEECASLTSVALFDTRSVTNMSTMFYYCTSLTSVPLFDTRSATYMNSTFNHCTSLTTVPLFNTSSVTGMSQVFEACTSLTTVPLFNTSSVISMYFMFEGCSSLTTVPLFNTSSVTYMNSMFKNCRNVASGAYALYQQASTQTTPPPNYSDCFTNCGVDTVTGAAELAQIPSSWGGTMA